MHGVSRWDHTNNCFYSYRILKFNDIAELKKTILLMFDAYYNILPNDLQQLKYLYDHALHAEHINL